MGIQRDYLDEWPAIKPRSAMPRKTKLKWLPKPASPKNNPGYEAISESQIALYQKYFDAIFSVIDIHNYTLWATSKGYDGERLKGDDRLIDRISCEEAASYGLSPPCLQVMIHQYFFADPWVREQYQDKWAKTVVCNKDKLSFFPGAIETRKLLAAANA